MIVKDYVLDLSYSRPNKNNIAYPRKSNFFFPLNWMTGNTEGLDKTKRQFMHRVYSAERLAQAINIQAVLWDQKRGSELGHIQALSVAINKGLEEWLVVGDGLQDAAVAGDIADRPLAQSRAT